MHFLLLFSFRFVLFYFYFILNFSIFRADREYRYRFDGQLSAGIPLDIVDQHAITRIQALVTIQPRVSYFTERNFFINLIFFSG